MQAITTKFLAPTNYRGARILAKCARGKLTVPFLYGDGAKFAHETAKKALCKKFAKEDAANYGAPVKSNPWLRRTISGETMSGEFVHVFAR